MTARRTESQPTDWLLPWLPPPLILRERRRKRQTVCVCRLTRGFFLPSPSVRPLRPSPSRPNPSKLAAGQQQQRPPPPPAAAAPPIPPLHLKPQQPPPPPQQHPIRLLPAATLSNLLRFPPNPSSPRSLAIFSARFSHKAGDNQSQPSLCWILHCPAAASRPDLC